MLNLSLLKEKRKQANLTQKDLAQALNISEHTYLRIEKGDRAAKVNELNVLAHLLGTTADVLLGSDPTKKAPADNGESMKSDVEFVKTTRSGNLVNVPLLSEEITVCCSDGLPVFDITNQAEHSYNYSIDELGGTYDEMCPPVALRANGSCLESWRIFDGDILVINPALVAQNWDPVVVVWKGAISAKIYIRHSDGSVELRSDKGPLIVPKKDVDAGHDVFYVWGVIVDTRRKPRRGM